MVALLALCNLPGWAQSNAPQSLDESLTRITTDRLSGLPGNWKAAGAVQMSPTETAVKSQSGNTLLVGTPGQPVTLLTNAKDVRLVMDVMVSPGAEATLSIGPATIRVADSWGQPAASASNFGTLERTQPILPDQNACKAPGLWQQLEVVLQSSGQKNARLELMTLNGVTLHENTVLPAAASSSTGTITLNVKKGTVALRNVAYQLISDRSVAKLTNLKYRLYEAKTETTSPEQIPNLKFVKEDTLPTLTYEITYGQPRWHAIMYTGNLVVDKAGTYTVALQNGGYAGLKIDDKQVIAVTTLNLGKMNSTKVNLTAGSHPFTLFFGRSWPRPGLGMFIAAPDTKFQMLTAPASLPEPDPVGTISVEAADEPVMVRSFVLLPGETRKRTHALSVGTPSGINYTLDLNQDALLQVWRGGFADVTEMWYERGEPQLLEPEGSPVRVSGQGPLAVLGNAQQAWPDSLNDSQLAYKGYKLDPQGYPMTQYQVSGLQVTDAVIPETDGKALARTITVNGSGKDGLYCRLATGSTIEEVGKGLYAVNDRSYYLRVDPKQKVNIRTSGNRQELVMPVDVKGGSAKIQYSFIF